MASVPCLLFGVACSAKSDGLPPIEFEAAHILESKHFKYYIQEGDDSVCEAVLETLERHFDAVQAFLGFPWPEGRKIKYYKLLEGDDTTDFGCIEGSLACYRGEGELVSPEVFHKHELIHAYLGPVDYDHGHGRPPFLEEGVAEALGPTEIRQSLIMGEWRDIFDDSPFDNPALGWQAAGFVGHLLNHYPVESFMAWFLSVEYRDSVARMAAQFEKAYGRTVDEVWEEAIAQSLGMIQPKLVYECSGPAISPDDELIRLEAPGCNGERFKTLRVDGETTVVLRSSGTARPRLLSCEQDLFVPWYNMTLVSLPPEGSYLLYRDEDEVEDLTFSFEAAASTGVVAQCSEAEPLLLPDVPEPYESVGLTLSVPQGEWYVILESPAQERFLEVDGLEGNTLEWCTGCDGECQPLDPRGAIDFDDKGQVLLRLLGQEPETRLLPLVRLKLSKG